MPDLDQLLDTLVADVTAGTHPPGASTAIAQARRGRAKAAAAGAVALLAVGGTVATGTHGGGDRPAPIGTLPTSSSAPPTVQGSAEPSPGSFDALETRLDAAFALDPRWAIIDGFPAGYDYAYNGACSGSWAQDATRGSDGGLRILTPDGNVTVAGIGHAGFSSQGRASHAAARFVANLESCPTTAWRTRPIAGTGVVLASSPTAVAWIQRKGADVRVLQVATTDGPPPARVRVAVAEWMVAYSRWQERN